VRVKTFDATCGRSSDITRTVVEKGTTHENAGFDETIDSKRESRTLALRGHHRDRPSRAAHCHYLDNATMSNRASMGPATSNGDQDDRSHLDRLLDEALKDTFPASDPPSIATPR
jgi:hypothetical protein